MGSQFFEENAPNRPNGAWIPPEELPHGLVQPPQVVLDLVTQEAARLPMNDEARKRITTQFTLQYYYDGWEIAYRRTPEGAEVLAVGYPEITELFKRLTADERQTVLLYQP
jgi:hypothetical protein